MKRQAQGSMLTVTLLTTLKPGVPPSKYEQWARQRDYSFMESLDCVKDFSIRRIEGDVTGAVDSTWMYVEQFTLLDADRYAKALKSEEGEKLRSELFELIDREKTVRLTSKVI